MEAPSVAEFVVNIKHLVAHANLRAKQHPQILSVSWMPVLYDSIPNRVQFIVHYVPNGGTVVAQQFTMDARIITNCDEAAFLGACQSATE